MTPADVDREPDGYLIASLLQHCLGSLRTRGVEVARLGGLLGVDLDALMADPNGWVPVRVLADAVRMALTFHPDPLLGLHASSLDSGASFGVLGYLTQTCATLHDVFEATARYERLVSDIGITRVRHEPGVALCCWQCDTRDPVFRRHATEFLLASWIRHIRLVKEPSTGLLREVRFSHGAPEDPALLAEYERYFDCPVKFNQADSALVIPAPVMSFRLRMPNPSLQLMLERHARLLLAERNTEPSILDQIKARLRVLLMQGAVSRDHLASELGVSSRHLHRQLQKAGSSYSQLMDDIRGELAKSLLQDDSLTVEAVALRLGFKEAPSFIRWFRQTAGQTPGEFRQQARAVS